LGIAKITQANSFGIFGENLSTNSDGSFNNTKKGSWYDLTSHNAYIKDSKGKNTRLQFNDQSDIKYFNGEKLPKFLQLITNQLIEEILNERKVNQLGFSSETEKYKYIYEQSGSTKNLDFAGSIPTASLAVFNEIIYNDKDFGNFLWGASMQKLGVPFEIVNSGSEFNGFWNGKVQNGYTPKFYIDRITWSGDAHEDQVAIRNGYLWALKNPKK
jgi:hypothetical protein